MHSSVAYDLDAARTYWRHAPSGAGKHDTSEMRDLPESEIEAVWNDAFERRFRQYPEEAAWLRQMASEFSGKRVLSIGPGIGLHEIYYQIHGARMTCCDIVESNLDTIRKIATLKGAAGIEFLVSTGADHPLGGPYDIVFIYGSLMTMPESQQHVLLRRAMEALAPDGRIVLMLYTWAFAQATCGWTSRDQFDPQIFARASDPSVGAEHCPWSDWHDEEKLEHLLDGEMYMTRAQNWLNDWYVWYEFARSPVANPTVFFEGSRLFEAYPARDLDLNDFQAAVAEIERKAPGIRVTTGRDPFGYAVTTKVLHKAEADKSVNAILIEADIAEGAFSVGLLDDAKNSFVATAVLSGCGPVRQFCQFAALPDQYRIILSNHQPDGGSSVFTVRRVSLVAHEPIRAPQGHPQPSLALPVLAQLRTEFPRDYDDAVAATESILGAIAGGDFSSLAKHSPGLAGYPWDQYVGLSVVRLMHTGKMLDRVAPPGGRRLLDFGSYFGNFSLFAHRLGYDVDAADNYSGYGNAFAGCITALEQAGINVIDLGTDERDLEALENETYDVILCMGVIEHIPHTPRILLESLHRTLKLGGSLIVETPNIAYLYKRERLSAGQSVFPPIEQQFGVEPPFEGHQREYTAGEVRWMLEQIGHDVTDLDLFNFSLLAGDPRSSDGERWRRMQADPELREIIIARSIRVTR